MIYAWLLFSFRGRVNRARYLVVQLALLTFWLVLWPKFSFHFSSQWEALQWVVAIPMIWINAAITVKRLHDLNRSGWWAVAILIVNRLSYIYYGLFFGLYFGVDISTAREFAARDACRCAFPSADLDCHRVVFHDGNRWTQPVRT